jgi:hypothetical protein
MFMQNKKETSVLNSFFEKFTEVFNWWVVDFFVHK